MITKEQAQKEATHTDENGYLYRVIGEKAQSYCVDYFDLRMQAWCQDMGSDFSHLIPLKKAFSTIQCKAPCGTVGCFLYSHKNENGYVLVSPIFSCTAELATWAKDNGWHCVGGLNGWYEKG